MCIKARVPLQSEEMPQEMTAQAALLQEQQPRHYGLQSPCIYSSSISSVRSNAPLPPVALSIGSSPTAEDWKATGAAMIQRRPASLQLPLQKAVLAIGSQLRMRGLGHTFTANGFCSS